MNSRSFIQFLRGEASQPQAMGQYLEEAFRVRGAASKVNIFRPFYQARKRYLHLTTPVPAAFSLAPSEHWHRGDALAERASPEGEGHGDVELHCRPQPPE